MKRRLLDLCCGGGLAGAGYWRSGCFSEICGVDNNPAMKPVYPFDFVCADMLTLTYDFLLQFDFIHASPPCQAYSYATPEWARDRHLRLIPGTHLMLKASGLPHVIENVPGSALELRPNLALSGLDVGLPMKRPRYFHVFHEKAASWSSSEVNSLPFSHISPAINSQISDVRCSQISGAGIPQMSIDETSQISVLAATHQNEISRSHSSHNLNISSGANLNRPHLVNVHGDEYVSRDEMIEVFGLRELPVSHLRRLTIEHMKQGIPPAMTQHIALKLFPKVMIA
jgi:hypothetical protein